MSDPDPDENVLYGGGARPGDRCYATVVCVDDEIVEWLARRERRAKAVGSSKYNFGRSSEFPWPF